MTFTEHNARESTDELDDDTVRLIAAHRGVICVHFMDGYIHPRDGTRFPTVEDLVDHIDRVRQVVGIDYVGLGPDYSPMQGWRWVEGAERFVNMPNVAREMVRKEYADTEIRKVLGLNLMRVYSKVWGKWNAIPGIKPLGIYFFTERARSRNRVGLCPGERAAARYPIPADPALLRQSRCPSLPAPSHSRQR